MGYVGFTARPASMTPVSTDFVRSRIFTLTESAEVGHVSIYLDGRGADDGSTQLVRAVIHSVDPATSVLRPVWSADGSIVAGGPGGPQGWVEFVSDIDPPRLEAGTYTVGLQGGPGTAARIGTTNHPPNPGRRWADNYADGIAPSAAMPGGSAAGICAFVHYRAPGLPEAPDEWYAQLGWWSAQEVFSSTPVDAGSAVNASCGWHGEKYDPAIGAFAIVRTDGPLADLVGERLRVSVGGREAYVYCHDERDIAEDISLTRRAFAELAILSTEELNVTVEVMS